MKLTQFVFITCTALAATQAAQATETSVDFPIGQKHSSFNCIFDTPGQVKIDTDGVKIRGFCAGDPGVSSPGHWQGSSDDLKGYYLSVVKSATTMGKVTISSEDITTMHCDATSGDKQPYPHGSKYCDRKGPLDQTSYFDRE